MSNMELVSIAFIKVPSGIREHVGAIMHSHGGVAMRTWGMSVYKAFYTISHLK